jgi:hypothetical protein
VSLVPLCVGLLGRERASTTSHVPTAVGRVRSPDRGSATTTLFNRNFGPHNNRVRLSPPGPQSRPIPAVPTSSRPGKKLCHDGMERNHMKTASTTQRRWWLGHRGGGDMSFVYTRSGGDIYTGSLASTRGTPLADRRHPVGVRFSPVVLTSSSPFHRVHLSGVCGLC